MKFLKLSILSFTWVMTALNAAAQVSYSVSGKVNGLPTGSKVYLIRTEGQDPLCIDSATVSAGSFAINGTMKRASLCKLSFYLPGDDTHHYARRSLPLFVAAEPMTLITDTATLLGDAYEARLPRLVKWQGSKINDDYQQYLIATADLKATADSAGYKEANAWFENNGDNSKIIDYKQRTEAAKKAWREAVDEYIFSHSNEWFAAAILSNRIYETFQHSAAELDKYMYLIKDNPDTAHVNFMSRNLAIAKKYTLGNHYIDFMGKQPDGSMVKLSQLMDNGKYLLIDFWASWCGPCRAAIPKVKQMAKDYADRLQVVSCSVDEKEAAWRKAMAAEKMPWKQLLLEKENFEAAANAYQISAIPRLVLINPQGEIMIITHDPEQIKQFIIHNS